MWGKMNIGNFVGVKMLPSLIGIWSVLLTCVGSVPVGGYQDSLQSLGYGYGGGNNRDSGYGNEPANYDFQYEVYGGGNFFGHQESRRDEKTNGKYHVLLPDGRRQIVTYIADETGYHPTITYEVVGSPVESNSGGYGGNDNRQNSGGYGGNDNRGTSGGYGGNDNRTPASGYGSPLSDNNLGSGPVNRYSSRIKRQFYAPEDYSDVVKIYRSESNPNQRFRNRRRRRHSAPKKGYLIVYPESFSRSAQTDEMERILVPES